MFVSDTMVDRDIDFVGFQTRPESFVIRDSQFAARSHESMNHEETVRSADA